jgi:O-antigen/teichoic acid export membrane protein
MKDSSLKQKTAKGLFWGGFSSGAQQVMALAFGIILARILNAGDYGLVAEITIFVSIATSIVNCGFATALTNKTDATHRDFNAVFWFSTITGLSLYLILYFCAPMISAYYKQPELTALSRFVFLSFVFGGLSISSHTVIYKNMMTRRMAIIETTSLLVSCLFGIILAFNGFSYWALAIQSVMFIFMNSILKFFVAPWKPTFSFDFTPIRQMFAFGVKLMITGIFYSISSNVFAVILGKTLGKTDAGNFSQGQKWSVIGSSFINGIVNYVTQPVLAQISDDHERQANVLRKLIRFGAFISFPLMLGLAFIGKEFIVITIGEKWLPSVPFLQLFCLWASIQFIVTLFSNLIFTKGKSSIYMYIHILTGTAQLAAIWILSQWGIFVMVTGYVAVSFLSLIAWQYFVTKLIGLKTVAVIKDILPYPIISILCFGITWLLTRNIDNIYFLCTAKIALSAIFYLSMLKLCGSVILKESLEYFSDTAKRFINK